MSRVGRWMPQGYRLSRKITPRSSCAGMVSPFVIDCCGRAHERRARALGEDLACPGHRPDRRGRQLTSASG